MISEEVSIQAEGTFVTRVLLPGPVVRGLRLITASTLVSSVLAESRWKYETSISPEACAWRNAGRKCRPPVSGLMRAGVLCTFERLTRLKLWIRISRRAWKRVSFQTIVT